MAVDEAPTNARAQLSPLARVDCNLADPSTWATRSVLGYAMADHMRASLVVQALRTAAGRMHLPEGAIPARKVRLCRFA